MALTSISDVEHDDLPCQNNDIDLWFSEYPAKIDQAKALCAECPVRDLVPGRCARARGVCRSLGRTVVRERRHRGLQTWPRPAAQERRLTVDGR